MAFIPALPLPTAAPAPPLGLGAASPLRALPRRPAPRRAATHMVASPEDTRAQPAAAPAAAPATPATDPAPDLDWENLGFQYMDTGGYMKAVWKDGEWGPLTQTHDAYIRLHVAATALHYGQSCFEGLKAFRSPDGTVRIFRPDENAQRMQRSAERLLIPPVPRALFLDAVHAAVRANERFVPPYGTGGSLYIRPLLFGTGARIGLQPADEFTFLVLVLPVGDYYKGGLSPVTAIVMEQFDRAAPRGVGNVKVAGNYAADLMPNIMGKKAGYPINLYLDAQNRRSVEEFGTSNFIAVKGNTYITPDSPSVLPSITNKTLMALAEADGMTVERRAIDIDEVADLDEVAACGTAVVITAVTRLLYQNRLIEIGKDPDTVGPRLLKLYNRVRAIQYGEEEDPFGWAQPVRSS